MIAFRLIAAAVSLACGLACAKAESSGVSELRLVADVRIGGDDSGPEFHFAEIAAIIPHDSVFVTQRADQTIRMYNLDGRFIRRIGRSGAGPGEFEGSVWKMGMLVDTLWAIDEGRRVSYFALNGDVLKTTTYGTSTPVGRAPAPFFFAQPQALSVGAGALGFGSYFEHQRAAGLVPMMPILSLTREGLTVDTLAWVSTANGTVYVSRGPYRVQPFSDEPLLAYSPSGDRVFVVERTAVAEANGATFRVSAIAAAGDTLWSHAFSYVPKPLDAQVVDSVRNWMRAKYAGWVPPNEIDRALFVPKFQNTVTAIVSGVDNSVWLRREDGDTLVRHTLLDTAGTETASAIVPRSVQLLWVSTSHVWGYELDDDDVPTIVRFRIDSGSAR